MWRIWDFLDAPFHCTKGIQEMRAQDLKNKIRKVLEMQPRKFLLNGIYFSPLYSDRLPEKIEELPQLGFNVSKTETESPEGSIISATISSPSGETLDLGSVLLDGKRVTVEKSLIPIDDLLAFIEENSPIEF